METLKCSHFLQDIANNAERLKKGFNYHVGRINGFSLKSQDVNIFTKISIFYFGNKYFKIV